MAYTQKLRKPATFDHLRKKEPQSKTVEILLSDAAVDDLQRLQDELSELGSGTSTSENRKRKELLKAIDDAKAAVDEDTVALKFQAIGRKAYDDLVTGNPATDEQKKEAEDQGLEANYNPDTFPQALVSASCIEPKMTPEEVDALFDEWNTVEVMQLFGAALEVNTTTRRMPNLFSVSGRTAGSETS